MLASIHTLTPRKVGAPGHLTLLVENTSNYMVKATISYPVNGRTHKQMLFLPAGLSAELNAIILKATDLDIELCFDHVEELALHVHEPERARKFGYGHLKLSGNRPEPPQATWLD